MIYDIAIIGAGPAGSTFAHILSNAEPDLKILILDGQNPINNKPCGGLLSPDAQKVLARMDLALPKSILVDPQIFSVKTIDLFQNLIRNYPRLYINMNRYAFDQWLISLLSKSVDYLKGKCIRIEQRSELLELTINNGDAKNLYSDQKTILKCRQIVGADGANSLVRRTFFKQQAKYYIAIQQWFQNKEKEQPIYYCVFDSETSEACSWLMHKDEYMIYGGAFSPKNSRENFEKQKIRFMKSQDYSLSEPLKTEVCKVLSPRCWKDFVLGQPGIYLIGEAAGLISASSFEGFSYAFESGLKLAESFIVSKDKTKIIKIYKKKMRTLRLKLLGKIIKHGFIYNSWTRKLIMKSRINSIRKVNF